MRRKTLEWYSRYDLFAGLMAGHELVLGREWFGATDDFYRRQLSQAPTNIDFQIESAVARQRLTAMDMATLFAKLPRGEISVQDFMQDNAVIAERTRTWMDDLSPLLDKNEYIVNSFEGARPRERDDIVDPYIPGRLYQGDLWSLNFMVMQWISLEIMHRSQTAKMLQQQLPPDLAHLALEICQRFEAIEYWPHSPPGAIVAAQAAIGVASLYLPKDERHIMWCRRKLATVEGQGLVPSLRHKYAIS